MKKEQKIILAAGTAIFFGAAVYGAVSWQYEDRLLPGTRINQTVCGKMTLEDTEEVIRRQAEDYDLKLIFRDGQEVILKPEDMDYHYVSDGGVEEILQEQSGWMWLPAMFSPREYEVGENVDFNRKMLGEFVDSLPQLDREKMTAPEVL